MAAVTVRYFAGARAAAGVETETVEAGTLHELLALLGKHHGDRLVAVLDVSSYLLDGVAVTEPSTRLTGTTTIDVLPPFAGG